MERFLRYSLEHQRPIKAMLMLDGALTQKTVTVLALENGQTDLKIGARKNPVRVNVEDILSCDYARGDHGEE